MKMWMKIIGDGGNGPIPMWQEARDFVNDKLLPHGVAPERIQISYGGYLNKEFLPSMPHPLIHIAVVIYYADHEYE